MGELRELMGASFDDMKDMHYGEGIATSYLTSFSLVPPSVYFSPTDSFSLIMYRYIVKLPKWAVTDADVHMKLGNALWAMIFKRKLTKEEMATTHHVNHLQLIMAAPPAPGPTPSPSPSPSSNGDRPRKRGQEDINDDVEDEDGDEDEDEGTLRGSKKPRLE
jgi:hypothetical protein